MINILQYIVEHPWVLLTLLPVIFVIGYSIEDILSRTFKHRQEMQKLKNEELRIQLQIEQRNSAERVYPKETSRNEYEAGYQQQDMIQ